VWSANIRSWAVGPDSAGILPVGERSPRPRGYHTGAMSSRRSYLLRHLLPDLVTLVRRSLTSRAQLVAENLFLRKQLALCQERLTKPRRSDPATRVALVVLSRWVDWRAVLNADRVERDLPGESRSARAGRARRCRPSDPRERRFIPVTGVTFHFEDISLQPALILLWMDGRTALLRLQSCGPASARKPDETAFGWRPCLRLLGSGRTRGPSRRGDAMATSWSPPLRRVNYVRHPAVSDRPPTTRGRTGDHQSRDLGPEPDVPDRRAVGVARKRADVPRTLAREPSTTGVL